MQIAFVLINANRIEGTSRAVVEVAERLGQNHDVTIIARSNETLDLKKVTWHKVASVSWPDVAEFESFRWGAESFLRKHQFDIIHSAGCNVWNADVYAIQTVHPRKMQINQQQNRDKSVGMLRRLTRQLYDSRVLISERMAYKNRNKRGIVGYLPVSMGTDDELRSVYGLKHSIIEIIPNGADLEKFSPELRTAHRVPVRREIYCDDRSMLFLFAGGEWRRKGLDLAIEAMSKMSDRNCCLAVAGDDPERSHFQAMAKQRGVEDRVRWLGFRRDIERVYAAADAFIFPSAYEAFSLATIEAAAAGLPVVMCDISGARDLVGDEECGFIVDRTADAFATIMDKLVSDQTLSTDMGRVGRAKVERLFNWDRIADQTLMFYRRLLDERARQGSR